MLQTDVKALGVTSKVPLPPNLGGELLKILYKSLHPWSGPLNHTVRPVIPRQGPNNRPRNLRRRAQPPTQTKSPETGQAPDVSDSQTGRCGGCLRPVHSSGETRTDARLVKFFRSLALARLQQALRSKCRRTWRSLREHVLTTRVTSWTFCLCPWRPCCPWHCSFAFLLLPLPIFLPVPLPLFSLDEEPFTTFLI